MKALFDTNILVDFLNGIPASKKEISRYDQKLISIVSWMEVLVGTTTSQEESTVLGFLDSFVLVELSSSIAMRSVKLRRAHRMRLPDAIIWASAQAHDALLITRNTKDFPADDAGIRVPYKI